MAFEFFRLEKISVDLWVISHQRVNNFRSTDNSLTGMDCRQDFDSLHRIQGLKDFLC